MLYWLEIGIRVIFYRPIWEVFVGKRTTINVGAERLLYSVGRIVNWPNFSGTAWAFELRFQFRTTFLRYDVQLWWFHLLIAGLQSLLQIRNRRILLRFLIIRRAASKLILLTLHWRSFLSVIAADIVLPIRDEIPLNFNSRIRSSIWIISWRGQVTVRLIQID